MRHYEPIFHLQNSGNKEKERKISYLRTIIGGNTKKQAENCILLKILFLRHVFLNLNFIQFDPK